MVRDCDVEGCGRPTGIPGTSRGLCSGHYHRWQRHGDPLLGGVIRDHDQLSGLARRFQIDDETGCWIWTGSQHTCGYGSTGKNTAHRAMWEQVVGPVPDGLQLDHLCRNRLCVNPDHLEPVTQTENVRRGYAARRAAA